MKFLLLLSFLTLIACQNKPVPPSYSAYKKHPPLSFQNTKRINDNPYRRLAAKGHLIMESIPYTTVNTSLGDLCGGITNIYRADSFWYSVERYFDLDNSFLSENGECIVYVNQYWKRSSDAHCSNNIVEFYQKGQLTKAYSYEELLKTAPNSKAFSWLIGSSSNNPRLLENSHYLIGDSLYLIPDATGQVLILDVCNGELLEQVDTSSYLKYLQQIPFSVPEVYFFPVEEREYFPALSSKISFRQGLAQQLSTNLLSTNQEQEANRYYFYFFIDAMIDHTGKATAIHVHSNEQVLTELSDSLCLKIKEFIAQQVFEVDGSTPYGLNTWLYKDRFYLSRTPFALSHQDQLNYTQKVCTLDSLHGQYIPLDVVDAHQTLHQILDDSSKAQLKRGENSHFGLGMWMRNNWGLWSGGRLKCYFNKRGLYHPDHISGFILHTYQLQLIQQNVNLDSLLLEYAQAEQAWRNQ